MIEIIVILRYN